MNAQRRFIVRFEMAPGDVSMLTALVRDLKLTYGDRYAIDVRTNFPAIWRHNPYLTALNDKDPKVETLRLGATGVMAKSIRESNKRKMHFVTYFHDEFSRVTKIEVPCLYPRPDIHLSQEEKDNPLIAGRYWIIVPGGKLDMTNKMWSQARYQEVVDKLRPWGLRFVQEGATKPLCVHPPLERVLNMVGRTSVRDLLVNIYHAEGVICGVTFQMHAAAAFYKPCVVLGGGRENPWWESYIDDWKAFGPKAGSVIVPHRYLHTLGLLGCCKHNGCWKQRVVRLNDRMKHDKSLCHLPVSAENSQIVPKCLDLITSDHVCEAVMSYYEDGTLEPIGVTTGKYSLPPDLTPASPEPRLARVTELLQERPDKPVPAKVANYPVAMLPKPVQPAQAVHTGNGLYGVLDHPRIGGKVSICVLLYGKEYEHLHKRCLNSIVNTVPSCRMDLRIALNQVGDGTMRYIKTLPVSKTYIDYNKRRKYPAMREIFWDQQDPLTINWVIWFDDDSYVRQPLWLQALAEAILATKETDNVGMFGQKKQHIILPGDKGKNALQWLKASSWWRQRQLRNKRGIAAPNGNSLHFVTGGFWAISRAAIVACDVPDKRLNHNGGDVLIGEQLWQNSFELREFNTDKKFIHTSAAERRGHSELFAFYR